MSLPQNLPFNFISPINGPKPSLPTLLHSSNLFGKHFNNIGEDIQDQLNSLSSPLTKNLYDTENSFRSTSQYLKNKDPKPLKVFKSSKRYHQNLEKPYRSQPRFRALSNNRQKSAVIQSLVTHLKSKNAERKSDSNARNRVNAGFVIIRSIIDSYIHDGFTAFQQQQLLVFIQMIKSPSVQIRIFCFDLLTNLVLRLGMIDSPGFSKIKSNDDDDEDDENLKNISYNSYSVSRQSHSFASFSETTPSQSNSSSLLQPALEAIFQLFLRLVRIFCLNNEQSFEVYKASFSFLLFLRSNNGLLDPTTCLSIPSEYWFNCFHFFSPVNSDFSSSGKNHTPELFAITTILSNVLYTIGSQHAFQMLIQPINMFSFSDPSEPVPLSPKSIDPTIRQYWSHRLDAVFRNFSHCFPNKKSLVVNYILSSDPYIKSQLFSILFDILSLDIYQRWNHIVQWDLSQTHQLALSEKTVNIEFIHACFVILSKINASQYFHNLFLFLKPSFARDFIYFIFSKAVPLDKSIASLFQNNPKFLSFFHCLLTEFTLLAKNIDAFDESPQLESLLNSSLSVKFISPTQEQFLSNMLYSEEHVNDLSSGVESILFKLLQYNFLKKVSMTDKQRRVFFTDLVSQPSSQHKSLFLKIGHRLSIFYRDYFFLHSEKPQQKNLVILLDRIAKPFLFAFVSQYKNGGNNSPSLVRYLLDILFSFLIFPTSTGSLVQQFIKGTSYIPYQLIDSYPEVSFIQILKQFYTVCPSNCVEYKIALVILISKIALHHGESITEKVLSSRFLQKIVLHSRYQSLVHISCRFILEMISLCPAKQPPNYLQIVQNKNLSLIQIATQLCVKVPVPSENIKST